MMESARTNPILPSIRGVLLDVDGTLWRGGEPVPGLVDFFAFLRTQGIGVRIVTNNSLKLPGYYRKKLAHFGVMVSDEEILTSATATGCYLAQTLIPGDSIYVIGEQGLLAAVREAGMMVAPDAGHPVAAVVVGGDRCLTYAKLKDAVLLLQRGARLIGANPDLLIPTAAGLAPETGVTLAALTAATGVSPTIIGKPERWLFDAALALLSLAPAQAMMVGDRLDTDIYGAQQVGMHTALVTTGVDGIKAIESKAIQPDVLAAHLGELMEMWRRSLDCIIGSQIRIEIRRG